LGGEVEVGPYILPFTKGKEGSKFLSIILLSWSSQQKAEVGRSKDGGQPRILSSLFNSIKLAKVKFKISILCLLSET
jgi:hypothetical protein